MPDELFDHFPLANGNKGKINYNGVVNPANNKTLQEELTQQSSQIANLTEKIESGNIGGGSGISTPTTQSYPKFENKKWIALGDSYTQNMQGIWGLLSTLGNKFGLEHINKGVVSSSVCGDGTNKGYQPFWQRFDTICTDYASIKDDVALITIMGGANDGFGPSTWIGKGLNDTDTNHIYGSMHRILSKARTTFQNAKIIVILQPAVANYQVSQATSSNGYAEIWGFSSLAELQKLSDIQLSLYANTLKQSAIRKIAETYNCTVCDCFFDFPMTIANSDDMAQYYNGDKVHLTKEGYQLIVDKLEQSMIYALHTSRLKEVEPKNVLSISVIYNGGNVLLNSDINNLKSNLVVTANYDDNTSEVVTNYTLSGSISNVGNNTITVTYTNKSKTFIVVGYESIVVPALTLFDNGNQYESVTGGWQYWQDQYNHTSSRINTILDIDNSQFSQVRVGAVITNEQLDLSNYSRMYVTCVPNKSLNVVISNRVSLTDWSSEANKELARSTTKTVGTTEQTVEIDISSIGIVPNHLLLTAGDYGQNIDVSKVWCE